MADFEVDFTLDEQPTINADFFVEVINKDHNILENRDMADQHPISAITGLESALEGKQDTLTAGDNIQIEDGVISATDTTYTAGTGISIENGVISNTQTSAEWGNITGDIEDQTDLQGVLNAKQDILTAGTGISIDNNVISSTITSTFAEFPNTWRTNGTVAQLMADITSDTSATKGMAYLGEVTCSDLPFNGNGELMVYIMDGAEGEQGKVIYAVLNSGNVSPYHWEITWWNNQGTWRSFIPTDKIDATPTQSSTNVITSGGVYTALADKQDNLVSGVNIKTLNENSLLGSGNLALSDIFSASQLDAIDSGATTTNIGQISTNAGDISTINGLIPAQATISNQLADKDFVNSSISTNTANFIGTFASITALNAYVGTVTNNDYAFVINSVITDNGNDWATFAALDAYDKALLTNFDYAWVINGSNFDLYRFDIVNQEWNLRISDTPKTGITLNTAYNRYKATVVSNVVTWGYEYTLNNSSFTASQWAAINSGITSGDVSLIGTALQPNDNISELVNDAGYITSSAIPTNYVTTDTAQSISGQKAFSQPVVVADGNGIGSGTILSNKVILQRTSAGEVYVSNTQDKVRLRGSETRPQYNGGDLALYSDIPTDNASLTNGAGYITGVAWGDVTGTLSNQTDLQNALNGKQDALIAGSNILFGLAPGYTPLDAIIGDGDAYLNLGIKLNQDDDIIIDFTAKYSASAQIFGYRDSASSKNITLFCGSGANSIYIDFNNSNYSSYRTGGTTEDNTRYIAEINKSTRFIKSSDGTVIASNDTECSDTFTTDDVYLFFVGGSPAQQRKYTGKIHRCTIKGKLDLVPCKRNSDNEIGMYDLIHDVFYSNVASTGSFTGGNEVTNYISFVNNSGFTSNIGTVTSVNNTLPDSAGNVTLSIPTVDQSYSASSANAQSGVAVAEALVNSLVNYVNLSAAQDITGVKTFIGDKRIKFKQSTSTNKLGFTLYSNTNSELCAFEYNPSASLLSLNASKPATVNVGFRYFGGTGGTVNMIAPKVVTGGDYYIPINVTDGNTTVTSDSVGTLDISTLLPTVNNATLTITQGGVSKGTFTANAGSDVTIALDAGGGSSYTAGTNITIASDVISTSAAKVTFRDWSV